MSLPWSKGDQAHAKAVAEATPDWQRWTDRAPKDKSVMVSGFVRVQPHSDPRQLGTI